MKIASLHPNDIVVINEDQSFVPIGETLARQGALPVNYSMIDLIARWDDLNSIISKEAPSRVAKRLDPKSLRPPVPNPSKIWAAASNYKRGSAGLDDARGRGTAGSAAPEELLERIFLKPPSAVTGPEQNIIIPRDAQTIFPELELCVVVGKKARHVPTEKVFDIVFGYTIILDVTARGYGSGKGLAGTRCVRKGFETFAPIGPWITTKDEIADPHNLWMKLWVNGELRQSAKTDSMVNDISVLLSYLSSVTTLYPGDLIATGNPDSPEFQQRLQPGDVLKSEIEGIGAMTLGVVKDG
jgi:2-keto-4-pentenoate hydratase/2-oxohepta-3-ene-1,7-dioic acid hydratase in catechol pathway